MKRGLLIVLPMLGFLVAVTCLYIPWDSYRYRTDRLQGKTPEQIVSEFGTPYDDSRSTALSTDPPGDFQLTYTRFGGGYVIHFKNGKVANVTTYSK